MNFAHAAKTSNDVVFKPHPYQKDAIDWVVNNQVAGLFLPPGLGKTASMLEAFIRLRRAGKVTKMLVVAPIRVCHMVWPIEMTKWSNFNALDVVVLHGPKKDAAIKADADVYCINPDGLKWFASKLARKELVFDDTWMLVVDESSNFKNATSQRFKLMKNIAKLFKRRTILTGTPAPNGLQNVWSQIFLLDEGHRLGKYVSHFFNRYFYPAGYMGYEKRLRTGADDEIYEVLSDIVMHKSRDEIDMPDLVRNIITVDLPPAARKAYNDMKNEFVAELNGGMAIAANGAVMAGKLKQIANGALYVEDRAVAELHNSKLEAVQELYDSLEGSPLLIFYEYQHDLARLKQLFPSAPVLGGGTTAKEAQEAVNAWNAGQLSVMLLHPQSAGHGLNLQAGGCRDICWFSITWDAELFEQAYSRVWRQGVKNAVTMHFIVAHNTIDQRILRVLDGKEKLQNALLSALER